MSTSIRSGTYAEKDSWREGFRAAEGSAFTFSIYVDRRGAVFVCLRVRGHEKSRPLGREEVAACFGALAETTAARLGVANIHASAFGSLGGRRRFERLSPAARSAIGRYTVGVRWARRRTASTPLSS